MSPPVVRPARPADAALIHALVLELAEFEKLQHEVTTTPADIAAALFGESARAFAEIVELDGEPVGFALGFYTFSTFIGRSGLYLEDLYVRPEARGRGAGKALLVSLARRCRAEGLERMAWVVLDWNAPAIAFYDRIGAASMDDWRVRRMGAQAIVNLAAG